jgi:hypothetical protein
MSLNPEEFLNQTTDEALDTQLLPVPEGEYSATASKINLREFQIKRGERAGQTGYSLDITWDIQDEGVASMLGRPPSCRQSLFLDTTEGGGLDFGKGRNVSLGRLRAAIGQNEAGKPWSPNMIVGSIAIVKVEHRIVEDATYSEVKRVAGL